MEHHSDSVAWNEKFVKQSPLCKYHCNSKLTHISLRVWIGSKLHRLLHNIATNTHIKFKTQLASFSLYNRAFYCCKVLILHIVILCKTIPLLYACRVKLHTMQVLGSWSRTQTFFMSMRTWNWYLFFEKRERDKAWGWSSLGPVKRELELNSQEQASVMETG